MVEKPRIVIGREGRAETARREFNMAESDVPAGVLAEYRRAAWETYLRLPWPAAHEEAWRRTDLRALPAATFRMPDENLAARLPSVPTSLARSSAAGPLAGQVLCSPAGARATLAEDLRRRGVIFTDWRTAERDHPEVLRHLAGGLVSAGEGKFAALAAALARDGVLLYIPKGVRLERPLQSILWGPGAGLAYFSHVLIWVDDDGAATYVHETASPTETADSFHAGLVEVVVGAGAQLTFVEVQAWGQHVWNITHARANVAPQGTLDWVLGGTGARLSKTFATLDLSGEGASGRISGFYFADGSQHLDYDTRQNHLAPHTTSDLLFKGALTGAARAVWRGMIYVAPGAQKTDGYQANRNLLLSPQARADSIPGLEICADDVRCTHGATVGRLEEEPLFYLLARGIPRREAERLLVEGFFEPIMQRIPVTGVRRRFQRIIAEKIASRQATASVR